jgi:hypothetical protein
MGKRIGKKEQAKRSIEGRRNMTLVLSLNEAVTDIDIRTG